MTKQTILAGGSEWGDKLEQSFQGMHESSEDVEFLMEQTARTFHSIAEANGSSVFWNLSLAEVHGDVDEGVDYETLETWRDNAVEEVWNEWSSGKLIREGHNEQEGEQ